MKSYEKKCLPKLWQTIVVLSKRIILKSACLSFSFFVSYFAPFGSITFSNILIKKNYSLY